MHLFTHCEKTADPISKPPNEAALGEWSPYNIAEERMRILQMYDCNGRWPYGIAMYRGACLRSEQTLEGVRHGAGRPAAENLFKR